jgi:hypothetical protein
MTKFKVYRISATGLVTVEIVEAVDWISLFSMNQYAGNPIFKVEVYGGPEPVQS